MTYIKFNFKRLCVILFYFVSCFSFAAETGDTIEPTPSYFNIGVDKVVVDVHGLKQMTADLSASINNLSVAIVELSTSETALDEKDRQLLIEATISVNHASQALSNLSRQLPGAIQGFSDDLLVMLKNTEPQIAAISESIQAASRAAININQSFPETMANSQKVVDQMTTDVMQKITLYIGLILLLFALVIGIIFYILYKTSIQPVILGLHDLRAVPQQLSTMSAYLHDTSEHLLILERRQNIRHRWLKTRRPGSAKGRSADVKN